MKWENDKALLNFFDEYPRYDLSWKEIQSINRYITNEDSSTHREILLSVLENEWGGFPPVIDEIYEELSGE